MDIGAGVTIIVYTIIAILESYQTIPRVTVNIVFGQQHNSVPLLDHELPAQTVDPSHHE